MNIASFKEFLQNVYQSDVLIYKIPNLIIFEPRDKFSLPIVFEKDSGFHVQEDYFMYSHEAFSSVEDFRNLERLARNGKERLELVQRFISDHTIEEVIDGDEYEVAFDILMNDCVTNFDILNPPKFNFYKLLKDIEIFDWTTHLDINFEDDKIFINQRELEYAYDDFCDVVYEQKQTYVLRYYLYDDA